MGHPGEIFHELRVLPQPGEPLAWWFAFNQLDDLPDKILEGRFRLMVDWFIDHSSTNPAAFTEETRELYATAYNTADAIRSSNGWYRTIPQDIADARNYSPITMPVLGLGGIYFPFVTALLEGRATDARFVEFPGAGHYLAEERPDELVRELITFFG